jgi:hypothetical protein
MRVGERTNCTRAPETSRTKKRDGRWDDNAVREQRLGELFQRAHTGRGDPPHAVCHRSWLQLPVIGRVPSRRSLVRARRRDIEFNTRVKEAVFDGVSEPFDIQFLLQLRYALTRVRETAPGKSRRRHCGELLDKPLNDIGRLVRFARAHNRGSGREFLVAPFRRPFRQLGSDQNVLY